MKKKIDVLRKGLAGRFLCLALTFALVCGGFATQDSLKVQAAQATEQIATGIVSAADGENTEENANTAAAEAVQAELHYGNTSNNLKASSDARLSVSDKKLWINGEATLTVTMKKHKDSEALKCSLKSKKSARVEIGEWQKDSVTVKLTALKSVNTTLTVSCGGEKVKVKLYLKKLEEMSAPDIYTYGRPAVVEIHSYDGYMNEYVGTGFFIGDGLILTDYHVIEATNRMYIKDVNGKKLNISGIVNYDSNLDLAIIRVEAGNAAALSFADSAIVGEDIYCIGNPLGITGTMQVGIISNLYREFDDMKGAKLIQGSYTSASGIGGSPVLNTKGQVVGVSCMMITNAQQISMFQSYETVKEFLNNTDITKYTKMADFVKGNVSKEKASNVVKPVDSISTTKPNSDEYTEYAVLSPQEIYDNCAKACVRIDILDLSGKYKVSLGTGFFINGNTILTNTHVVYNVANISQIAITDYDGVAYKLVAAPRMSRDSDVAVLFVEPVDPSVLPKRYTHPSLELSNSYIPKVGETVYTLGHPGGYEYTLGKGIVKNSPIKFDNYEYFLFEAPITPGSSGGPLLNQYGRVIGISNSISVFSSFFNFAIRVIYMNELA